MKSKDYRYGLILLNQSHEIDTLGKYEGIAELAGNYFHWKNWAEKNDLPGPLPVEYLDKSQNCRIINLEEISMII